MKDDPTKRSFRDAQEDIQTSSGVPDTEQTRSPAYRLAYDDLDFILRDQLRPVRLQLELLKPEIMMKEQEVESTIVLFGGARIRPPEEADKAPTPEMAAMSRFYDEARKFARIMTERSIARSGGREDIIITGGGPGVMEAGNRGAADAGGKSIGLNIVLPHEQAPNPYITPELSFNFHYFGVRKMHFLMRASAIAIFPGGFGTMDELFEALTLVQTGRMRQVPILLFGREFWEKVINFKALADVGTISPEDLELFRIVETAEEAVAAIDSWEGVGLKRGEVPGR
ncbi:TIGR00730 family Rossman fold protein [Aliiruegeria sabulilitoris]|uniref:LOG family protein n=1 Tax=Aliiruegeria sabulilitoris TaxID=1510458 RepID=UPI0008309037|nr:TIGR00730 family Rossman fold protein [Aliiruegeria sabulilitoris]NDR57677.1 TIGR00730 family Rossman fold protein [Pseudoruegeria sp. M32A2M]